MTPLLWPLRNKPFHKKDPIGIQTTGIQNHQFTILVGGCKAFKKNASQIGNCISPYWLFNRDPYNGLV